MLYWLIHSTSLFLNGSCFRAYSIKIFFLNYKETIVTWIPFVLILKLIPVLDYIFYVMNDMISQKLKVYASHTLND